MSATQFNDAPSWRGTLIPAAGEMSARYGGLGRRVRTRTDLPRDLEKNERDRLRRAERMVRRYVVANGLNQMVTLTFSVQPADGREAGHEVAGYFRRVKHRQGRIPFVWTVERGTIGGRVHAHALVPAFDPGLTESLWGRGLVDHQVFDEDTESLRAAAAYLSKDFNRGVLLDGQAYRVAKGFQPEGVALTGLQDPESVVREASWRMGADPTRVHSAARAPALTAFWDVRR